VQGHEFNAKYCKNKTKHHQQKTGIFLLPDWALNDIKDVKEILRLGRRGTTKNLKLLMQQTSLPERFY
jgi:hypothetical protein